MSQLTSSDNAKLAELQALCDQCKEAIEAQSHDALKSAMKETCEKCRSVRDLVPELMMLRQQKEAMTEN